MEEFASFVADGSSGFDGEQAASRVGELDAAAAVFASDVIMIGRWIVGVQAQSKTAFQLSWDQFVPAASQTPLQNAMADYFNGTIDADGWVAAVQSATADE